MRSLHICGKKDVKLAECSDCSELETKVNELDERVTALEQGGSDKHFVFNQSVPASTWNIEHGLEKYPSVTVVDSAGNEVVGDCEYIDDNNVVVTFSNAFSGKAYLN